MMYIVDEIGEDFVVVNGERIEVDLTLDDRIFVCKCGYAADRDLNAACNIEAAVLWVHGQRENLADERQPSRLAM